MQTYDEGALDADMQDEQVKEDSKAYQCEFCTQKIKSSRDLIKHCQKKHNKEIEKPVKKLLYGCDSCGKVYSEEQTLKYHIKTVHHTERCKFCGEKNTHMKRHEEKCKEELGRTLGGKFNTSAVQTMFASLCQCFCAEFTGPLMGVD